MKRGPGERASNSARQIWKKFFRDFLGRKIKFGGPHKFRGLTATVKPSTWGKRKKTDSRGGSKNPLSLIKKKKKHLKGEHKKEKKASRSREKKKNELVGPRI